MSALDCFVPAMDRLHCRLWIGSCSNQTKTRLKTFYYNYVQSYARPTEVTDRWLVWLWPWVDNYVYCTVVVVSSVNGGNGDSAGRCVQPIWDTQSRGGPQKRKFYQEQQRVAVGPGNAQFMFIRQVSLRRRPYCSAAAAVAAAAAIRHFAN